jgi:hypothetical protein
VTDYAPDYGYDTSINLNASVTAPGSSGVLVPKRCYKPEEVTDGLSNTFMVSEDAGRPQVWEYGKLLTSSSNDGGWADPSNAYITGNQSTGQCHTNCKNSNEVYSFHQGGAMHIFGDGGARFVKTSKDIKVFTALITRAGGEVANLD